LFHSSIPSVYGAAVLDEHRGFLLSESRENPAKTDKKSRDLK